MKRIALSALPLLLLSCGEQSTDGVREELHQKLKESHIQQPYGWESIIAADGAGGRIELIYSAATDDAGNHGGDKGEWNREHLWPRSYGIGDSGADFTDLHNLRPCSVATNAKRGNKYFDKGTSSQKWEPPDDEKGDIARAMFYMAVRYEGDEEHTEDLEITDSPTSGTPNFGRLSTLIEWHEQDPPDDAERARNDRVEALQGNRNPFVDEPGLVGELWAM